MKISKENWRYGFLGGVGSGVGSGEDLKRELKVKNPWLIGYFNALEIDRKISKENWRSMQRIHVNLHGNGFEDLKRELKVPYFLNIGVFTNTFKKISKENWRIPRLPPSWVRAKPVGRSQKRIEGIVTSPEGEFVCPSVGRSQKRIEGMTSSTRLGRLLKPTQKISKENWRTHPSTQRIPSSNGGSRRSQKRIEGMPLAVAAITITLSNAGRSQKRIEGYQTSQWYPQQQPSEDLKRELKVIRLSPDPYQFGALREDLKRELKGVWRLSQRRPRGWWRISKENWRTPATLALNLPRVVS